MERLKGKVQSLPVQQAELVLELQDFMLQREQKLLFADVEQREVRR